MTDYPANANRKIRQLCEGHIPPGAEGATLSKIYHIGAHNKLDYNTEILVTNFLRYEI
jgi:hypothetical protein